jgi:hypothetical protein
MVQKCIVILNYDKNLLPGMYMNAEIQLTSLKLMSTIRCYCEL